MALVNEHYLKLPGNYLFSDIAKKIRPWTKCPRLKHSMDTDQSKATIF